MIDCDYYNSYDAESNQDRDEYQYDMNIEMDEKINNDNNQSKRFTFFVLSDNVIALAFTNQGNVVNKYSSVYLFGMLYHLFFTLIYLSKLYITNQHGIQFSI